MVLPTEFAGISKFGQDTPNKMIKTSIGEFLNWGFLQIAAFVNVSPTSSGLYGNPSYLRPVKDPAYTDGTVWESSRRNWVWESGMTNTPNQCSGVYISGVFYEPDHPTFGHTVNYPLGRIIFNSPISTSLPIQAKYSYKWINIVDADTVPFFQQLQTNSLDLSSPQFDYFSSGDYFKVGETRIQPPLVAIEMPNQTSSTPYQLGCGVVAKKDVLFHVVSEDGGNTAGKIADIISMQGLRGIYAIDTNKLATDNKFPLTSLGSIASGAMTYPQMVETSNENGGYRWGQMYIMNSDITGSQRLSEKLFLSTVRMEIEVVLGSP